MEAEESSRWKSLQKISFGLGHVFNDLSAAMWFSYTLFYLQVVLTLESTTAGILLMIGQIVDALATPLAGWAIDYIGHQRLWHFGGTCAVSIGFSLIFSYKPANFSTTILIYYITLIVLFQSGWAFVQIAHLSIIPQISECHTQSSELTAIRYTASVCCSIAVYLITLIILRSNGESDNIGPKDFYKFKEIALIITFIGTLASVLFYGGLLCISEYSYDTIGDTEAEDANGLGTQNDGKHFLKSFNIYCISLMYMSSRLFSTLNLIYMPLYLDERGTLESMEKEKMRQTIATVPLATYVASLLTSIILKFRMDRCSDKIIVLSGSLVGLSASAWLGVGVSPSSDVQLYAIAILLGISGCSTMVGSLCLTVNFVKTNGFGGGRVYSIVTFTDKLISGGVVLLVQSLQCTSRKLCPHFYENVLFYVCGLVSLLGLCSLVLLEIQIRRNAREQ